MIEFFYVLVILGFLIIISILTKILQRPHPEFPKLPDSKLVSQSVLLKTDADVSTVLPVTLGATTCTHDWDVLTDKTLIVPHEQKQVTILKCRLCGSIDKTIVTTSKLPEPPKPEFRKENCCHRWDEEKSVTLASAFEQLAKATEDNKRFDMKKFELDEIPTDFFRKTYIKVRVCKVCGEIDKLVASNYDGVTQMVEE